MAISARTRGIFIDSILKFLREYRFDGVDIAWDFPKYENPTIWNDLVGRIKNTIGFENDKSKFTNFLEELRDVFASTPYLLAVSAPAAKYRDEDGFEGAVLQRTVDFVNLRAYDYHKAKDPVADHHSPLKSRPVDVASDVFNNVVSMMMRPANIYLSWSG